MPSYLIDQPNIVGNYFAGKQAKQQEQEGIQRNALLQAQQQAVQQKAQMEQQTHGQDQQRALIEDLAKATAWVQSQPPEQQAGAWNQVIDTYKPVMGDMVEQYRDPKFIGPVSAWAKSQLNATDVPSSVREYGFWKNLSPQEQDWFLNLKRAGQIKDIGGVPTLITPGGGKNPLSTLPAEVDAAAGKAAAVETAKVGAENTAKAAADLPRIESTASQMLQQIDALEKHPGLDYLIGGYALAPIVPGSPQADAEAIREQVQGAAFLQAFNQLKGSGQITEIEGAKATNAIARLQRKQSKAGFKKALADLRQVIAAGVEKARKQAQNGSAAPVAPQNAPAAAPSPAAPGKVRRFNPATGKIE